LTPSLARPAWQQETVAIRQNEKINTRALRKMFRQIIANNRAGGWRKIKKEE
jgi:hypothetical protein